MIIIKIILSFLYGITVGRNLNIEDMKIKYFNINTFIIKIF